MKVGAGDGPAPCQQAAADKDTGHLASSASLDEKTESDMVGKTLLLTDDASFTNTEMQILWSTLHELQGISASWEGKDAGAYDSEDEGKDGKEGDDTFQRQCSNDSTATSNSIEGDDTFQRQFSNDSIATSNSIEGSNENSKENSNSYEASTSGGDMVPSEKSVAHQQGTCRPCIYACKNKCAAGATCTFCHYPHELPKRPGKNSRRRAINRIRRTGEGSSSNVGDTLYPADSLSNA